MFSFALTSLKDLIFLVIYFSKAMMVLMLTKLNKGILAFNSFNFGLIINRASAISVLQLSDKTVLHLIQKHKGELLGVLGFGETQINDSIFDYVAIAVYV